MAGGNRQGNFYEPTILTGIEPGDEAYPGRVLRPGRPGLQGRPPSEEAVELRERDAVRARLLLMTTDPEQAERVADQIEAGMVYVNIVGADSPELPFGGFKRSGFGRELGRYGADEFVNKKLIRSA